MTQNMNTNTQALALIEPTDQRITALDEIARSAALITPDGGNPFAAAIATANGIARLKAALTPEVMAGVMTLQGSALGFRTDKDKDGGYPPQVVADALIEATMRGLPPVGNNFNIIGSRLYITKEGCETILHRINGLRYMITPQIPKMSANGAEAPVHVEWEYNGKAQSKDLVFPVRVNSGMGADAVNGKARRKAAAWLIAQVTGMEIPEGDTSDVDAPQTRGRFNPIDVTPTEQPQDDTPANFKEAGLTTEQVREMYNYYKWPTDGMAKVNPAALKEAWARYTQEVAK